MLRALPATALSLLLAAVCFAGDKQVGFETIPPGAEVEVNGSIVCTTPCSIDVPSYYFGAKHTIFAKHGDTPITVRLSRQGYVTKTIELTTGPIHWHNLNGINVYDYYLVSNTSYRVRLDTVNDFFSQPAPHAETPTSRAVSTSSTNNTVMSNEDIVSESMPSIVVVSTSDGWGSGFLVSSTGVVVTNAHVVRGHPSASVALGNGTTVESTDIFIDEDRDLALIKLPGNGYPFLKISHTLPAVGADVLAIGSPGLGDMRLTNTVTKGIVSGIRNSESGTWIQSDTAINHGNSGGPLINRRGEVVGVTTLRLTPSEYAGMNFSLASTEIDQLLHSKFGVQLSTPEPVSNQAGNAELEIASTPAGAEIQLDGSFVGSTPSTIGVVAGDHTIAMNKNGYAPWERRITVNGGKISVAAELETARDSDASKQAINAAVPLSSSTPAPPPHPATPSQNTVTSLPETLVTVDLTSNPDGATINVDDAAVGKAPMTLKLKPGQHAFRMFMNGYQNWAQWITIQAGPDVHVTATLAKSN
jgi:S1-C subfamily serine protease